MAIQLAEYADWLENLSPASRQTLDAHWQEATRSLSPRGLDNYLKGAAAL